MKCFSAKEFGLAIKERRHKLGYTQNQLSEVTGFSTSFISDLENGKETAEIGKAIHIATMLGLDLQITERG